MISIEVKKEAIVPALSMVQSIVDKKTIMNIINNVLIYTEDNRLFLEATDLEISYKTSVEANVKEQGSLTVNARKLYEIIKEIQSDQINIDETENNWIKIIVEDKAEYMIAGMPSDDFPRFREYSKTDFFNIKSEILSDLITKTIYSVSYDDKRYALSGILTEFKKKMRGDGELQGYEISMVSSDGHRLSLAKRDLDPENIQGDFIESSIIIPRKGANEIKKFCDISEDISFMVEDDFLYCLSGDNQLIIRLIDGTFPDYQAIIPQESTRIISFDRNDMLGALRRISILSSDLAFRGVKIMIEGKRMHLESIDRKVGQASENIDIAYEGEPMKVAFNAKYIEDTLKIMRSPTVQFIINDEDSPCVIKGNDDTGFLSLIMPMSIEEE